MLSKLYLYRYSKEFKKELRGNAQLKAAMKAAAAWAAAALAVGVTGAATGGGGEASADESGLSRAADIGKKRADRAAKTGHSHSHSGAAQVERC